MNKTSSNLPLTLLVGYRTASSVHAGPIDVSGDVADEFVSFTEKADEDINRIESPAAFDPDTEYTDDRPPVLLAHARDIIDLKLIQLLQEAHVNDAFTAGDVRERRPYLYALSVLRDDVRSIYVRATTPVKFAGKSIRGVLTDSFNRIEDPFLVFDAHFDFVVRGADETFIFNPSMFERITNSKEAAAAASQRLVGKLQSTLNLAVAGDGFKTLQEHLASNSFSRRKALSLSNKDYLRDLTAQKLSEVLGKHELAHSDFLDGDKLVVSNSNVKTLLALLNDDVFAGDFSGQEYTAERKSAL